MSEKIFILIITSYVIFGQSDSKPQLFDPETGDLIKIKYDPETGEIISNKTEVNNSLVNDDISNTGYDEKISYREIKHIAKNDAKIYINKNPLINAGLIGFTGLILGPLGLGIPAEYFQFAYNIKVPNNIPSKQVKLYRSTFTKEVQAQSLIIGVGCFGIGLMAFTLLLTA